MNGIGPVGGIDPDFLNNLRQALADPEIVNLLHQYSDYDNVPGGLHHTLGSRHDQSAYGDHSHNGVDSSSALKLQPQDKGKTAWVAGVGGIDNWSWAAGDAGGWYTIIDGWVLANAWTRTNGVGTYADPPIIDMPILANANTPNSASLTSLIGTKGLAAIVGSWVYRRASDGATWSGPLVYSNWSGSAVSMCMLAAGGPFNIQHGSGDNLSVFYSYAA